MKKVIRHVKKYIVRGLLAIIPLALTFFAVNILYKTIDQNAVKLADQLFGFSFPGLGILLVLASLYILGIMASNMIGRKIFNLIEKTSNYLPMIKTTYKVGQQLVGTFSLPERQVLKKAILVEYLKPGIWTIGFVTGRMVDKKNLDEKLLKVFIPTPPNPASGTMVVVKESQTRDPGWSIDDALKSVLSGGIIGWSTWLRLSPKACSAAFRRPKATAVPFAPSVADGHFAASRIPPAVRIPMGIIH